MSVSQKMHKKACDDFHEIAEKLAAANERIAELEAKQASIKADAMMEVAKSQRHFIEHLQKRISENVFYPNPSIHMLHMMTDDIEDYANKLRNDSKQ